MPGRHIFTRYVAVFALAGSLLISTAEVAAAAVRVSFQRGVLTFDGTRKSDQIILSCGVTVLINDVEAPGAVPCDSVKKIVVNGNGGNDQINLFQVGSAFDLLTSTDLRGGTGNDDITMSRFKDRVDGGDGSDRIGERILLAGPTSLTDSALTTLGQKQPIVAVESAVIGADVSGVSLEASDFPGDLTYNGNVGNDTVVGTSHADTLNMDGGSDTVFAAAGSDFIRDDSAAMPDDYTGGPGTDSLEYTSATSNMTATATTVTGAGSDDIASIEVITVFQTGPTGRTMDFEAFPGRFIWLGEAGNDVVKASQGGSHLNPGGGANTLTGGAGLDIVGLFGESSASLKDAALSSPGGTADLVSIEGADIFGTSGDDTFDFTGFSGQTRTDGVGGQDQFIGGSGPDTFEIDDGDTADGNEGTDTVDFFANTDATLTDTSVTGSESFTFADVEQAHFEWAGPLTLDATAFTGDITSQPDGEGAIRIESGSGDDHHVLGPGNDVALGGGGNDVLEGLGGNDTLNGQSGTDTCKGGPGTDVLKSCEKGSD